MKVKELIAVLEQLDQEHEILVNGYEGGYAPVSYVAKINATPDVNKQCYFGSWDSTGTPTDIPCYLIPRQEN